MNIRPHFPENCPYVDEIQQIMDDIDAGVERNAVLHRVTLLGQKATGDIRIQLGDMVHTALDRRRAKEKNAAGNRVVTARSGVR